MERLKEIFRPKLRFKITITVLIASLLTVFGAYAVSRHFIEDFYVRNAMNNLIKTYRSCNEFVSDEENLEKLRSGEIRSLYGYIDNPSSCTVFIIDRSSIYSTIRPNENVEKELQNIVDTTDFGLYKYKDKPYSILAANPSESKDRFYSLQGILNNDLIIILQMPIEQISTSISFAVSFFAFVALAFILFEIAAILFISNTFTRPIIQMSRVAKKMSNLDFNAIVDVKSRDEIGELGTSMNILSQKLKKTISELKTANLEMSYSIEERKQVEEMRSEFLSHASHELKTPIALIQGYAEGLKDSVNDDPESRDFYCDVIIDEATKMNKLVMRLINLNHLESGDDSLTIERFDLTELTRSIINAADILLKQRNGHVKFEQTDPVYVWADEFMIEEVITNYYSNAVHYLKEGGEIRVWFERKGDNIRLNVFNEGDKIDEKHIDKLFIKFYKADEARTREYGGSGIGLSIVEAIMKAHNRDYGVYNEENGVVFYAELDAKDQPDEIYGEILNETLIEEPTPYPSRVDMKR